MDPTTPTGTTNSSGSSSDSKEDTQMTDGEPDGNVIDPPDNTGGGGKAELDAPAADTAAIDPPSNDDKAAIDPPSNDGGS
jgi:hypothetical protein